MGPCIYIDIINFILLFLLLDLLNGIYNRIVTRKLKSGVLTIIAFSCVAFVLSFVASFFVFTKIALSVTVIVAFALIVFLRKLTIKLNQYEDVECGKEDFFSQKKVLILVPHEDDDINLAGGVIEQYVKYGSDVYVAFATNGDGDKRYDMTKMGYTRISEAVVALGMLGVPEKNIVFLGYGDGWSDKGPHIYNAQPDIVMESESGRTHTFGIQNHPAYHDGNSYTYSHYYDDIKQLISELRPDVIFCVDYDSHPEHRALSMFFEKVMGDILKASDYKPVVYKGFGYRTAWNSAPDFSDAINIKSTVNCPHQGDVELYNWDNRVRFPIDINSVNRQLDNSKLYKVLSAYASQRAVECSKSIINGDKVFWERRTDSVLYGTEISVSSGIKDKLTDFMLLDCDDLISSGSYPYDGVWCPRQDDDEKSVTVTFDEKKYINYIALYDNPSPEDNILDAVITLDDTTCINTGKLNPYGDATIIPVNKHIQSFTVKIEKFEGEHFGLCELEAYTSTDDSLVFHKLVDDNNDFVYDYIVPSHGKQVLRIYTNSRKKVEPKDVVLHCDNKKCSVDFCDDKIVAVCPNGQKCVVTLLSQKGKILDRVILRNPGRIGRYCLNNSKEFLNNRSYLRESAKQIQKIFGKR